MVKHFALPEERVSWRRVLLYMLLAWFVAFAMRLVWVEWVRAEPARLASSSYNGQIMINTNDGYWFAEGARDLLTGGHQPNDLSPVAEPLSKLTAAAASVLPFSLETIILYMPAVIGALLVIPVILAGTALGQPTAALSAALIAGVAHSYYNRTMVGYYDTDMLTIFFPTLLLALLLWAYRTHNKRLLPLIGLVAALNFGWYPQSYALSAAFAAAAFAYALVFERKNPYGYAIPLFILIGFVMIPLWIKAILILALWQLLERAPERIRPLWLLGSLYAAGAVLFVTTGGISPILALLKAYVFKEEVSQVGGNLFFYDIASTVREAGDISFLLFAERISGHIATFLLACVGFVLMILSNRLWLLALPMAGLGFLGLSSGLRFTVYAVPVMALSLAWLFAYAGRLLEQPAQQLGAILLLTAAALYPNYTHIRAYTVPTVFGANEVATLAKLGQIAGREDYTVSWWDYGYPIRYYADTKTLIDGGKHSGDYNWPVSFALTESNATAVAQLLRLYTEYTEKRFADKSGFVGNDVAYMLAGEGYKDPNAFLDALAREGYKLPAKSRDIYIMLPYRMMEIFPTVRLFSNLDLTNGQPKERSFFYSTQNFEDQGSRLVLDNSIAIDKTKWSVNMGGGELPLASVTLTHYENGRLVVEEQPLSPSADLKLIIMRDYNTIIVADSVMANSTFVKLFVLEEADSRYYEPVLMTPLIKVYKLKL